MAKTAKMEKMKKLETPLHIQGSGPNEQEEWDGWRPCGEDAISEVGR